MSGMIIKAVGDWSLDVSVPFGGPSRKDAHGEWFDAQTDFAEQYHGLPPLVYYHGFNEQSQKMQKPEYLGRSTGRTVKADGLWYRVELDPSKPRSAKMMKAAHDGKAVASPGTAEHLIRREDSGHLTHWPIVELSIFDTYDGQRQAIPYAVAIPAMKAIYTEAGIPLPDDIDGHEDQPATGEQQRADMVSGQPTQPVTKSMEDRSMNEEDRINAAVKAAMDARDAETKATQERESAIEAEVQKRVAAATKSTPTRPPFDAPASDTPEQTLETAAIKMFSTQRYGTLAAGCDQISKELYGQDYDQAAFYKHRALRQYIRTGANDPAYTKMLLLHPKQIIGAYSDGQTVGEIKATMQEAVGELGGFLVPEDYRLELIERLPGMTVIRPGANIQSTQSNLWERPRVTGGDDRYIGNVRVTWVDESPTAGASATNATLGKVSIPIHTVMGQVTLTRSQVEDGSMTVDELIREFDTAFAIDEDAQFLTGSGVGRPQGILNGTAASGAPFDTDVQTANSLGASTLTNDGIIAVPYKLAAQYRQNGAVWMMGKAAVGTIRAFKGTDTYFWADVANQMAGPQAQRLLGYGLEESEAMPAIAANKYPIIFGDRKGYTIVDRIGLSIERYLDSATAATDTIVIYGRRRLGGKVTDGRRFVVQKVSA